MLVAAAAWWIWQASYARYQTLNHFLVALVTVALISLWYVRCGGAPRRVRAWAIGMLWLGIVVFFALFRPVFNGDMGIYSWKKVRLSLTTQNARPRLPGIDGSWRTRPT